jgi:hypothetical protein
MPLTILPRPFRRQALEKYSNCGWNLPARISHHPRQGGVRIKVMEVGQYEERNAFAKNPIACNRHHNQLTLESAEGQSADNVLLDEQG